LKDTGGKKMITCPRCGKSNPDGTEFCLYCGYDLKKKADLATVRKNDLNAVSEGARTPEKKETHSKKNRLLIIVGIIVIVAIVLMFLFL
jgi:uncharacterized membrane protein YvbJ